MRKRRLVIGGVTAATVLLAGALAAGWFTPDTPGMAIMRTTGMMGYTPEGADRTFYSEIRAGKGWFGGGRDDSVIWFVSPRTRSSTLDVLKNLDRAAESAGFAESATPFAERPAPVLGPRAKVFSFERRRPLGKREAVLGAWANPEGRVEVVLYLDPPVDPISGP